jgi:hypothetical protein
MPHFKQTIPERFCKRFAVIQSVFQFGQSGKDDCKIIRIARLELLKKVPNRAISGLALIIFYSKFNNLATSILM